MLMCVNLTNPIKKDNELTLELKEILDNNDMTRYDIWISLVRSGIQIVECYEGITGYNKKLQLKESLLQIMEDLEGKDKDKVMNYYNTTLDATISAIIDAWKAKSPNKKSCFICF
jgi:predicted transcriptional regulator